MTKKRIMSGMRPTGKLHLGHYLGVLTNWAKLQNEYECYFAVADLHALTTKYDKTSEFREDIANVVLDWLAAGIDPEKANIYIQSLVPQTTELHVYLSMTTPQNWVERDPTLKDMAKILKLQKDAGAQTSQVSYGLLGYPVLMAADILTFNAHYVPVGVDQVAHIEITREIVRRFNNIYKTDYFIEPEPLLTKIPLLKGLDGQKMGKSFQNDIKISDDEKTTEKKIMCGITDRARIKRDDAGNPENCEVIYDYWKIFGSSEQVVLAEKECRNAQRGCADCKKQLAAALNEYLAPIRERRIKYAQNPKLVRDIIMNGSERARAKAQIILNEIKEIMGMYL